MIFKRLSYRRNLIGAIKNGNMMELQGINKIYGEKIKTQVFFAINLNIEIDSFNSIICCLNLLPEKADRIVEIKDGRT